MLCSMTRWTTLHALAGDRGDLIERGFNADKIRVYPRGVDTERFHPPRNGIQRSLRRGPGPPNQLTSAASKEKNLPLLSRAYEDPLSRAATSASSSSATAPTERNGRPPRSPAVFTATSTARPRRDSRLLHALVFPSPTDTFGNVVLEAQASGIPAIVTDVGGPRENVLHGETGLVAEATHEGLRAAMEALIMKPSARKAMGDAARRHVASRAFEPAFNRLYAMYVDERPPTRDAMDSVPPFADALRAVSSLAS